MDKVKKELDPYIVKYLMAIITIFYNVIVKILVLFTQLQLLTNICYCKDCTIFNVLYILTTAKLQTYDLQQNKIL